MTNAVLKKSVPETDMPWIASYPKDVAWDIAIPEKPLFSFLDETAALHPTARALTFAGHTYDYAAISTLINRAAKGLQDMGVRKGMKVGLFMPNAGYSVVMYYAILKSGATVVNYNPVYIERDLINQVEDSETDIMVTLDAEPLLVKAKALLEKTRINKIIVCPARQKMDETTKTLDLDQTHIWFCDLVANNGAVAPVTVFPKEDIAVLQYTGGTTGIPKGAALSHYALVANAWQMKHWYYDAVDGKDSIVAVLPLFHVFAMTVVMNMPVMKAMHILIQPQFSVTEVLDLIAREKPEYMAGVPTMYIALANSDRAATTDFSSLKFCLSGGAPLPADVKRVFEERTHARLVAEGYGLTEFSPVATCNPLSRKAKAGSIGLPIPGTIVEIISLDDGITPMAVGEKGEVCAQGPQMMQGYYKRPDETEKVIRNGRFHTGDVGYMDEDGFVYIVDRVKDMILVGGFNVYPRHVEEVIYTHPAVAECIVAGVPDKLRGEAVHAWVKPKDGNPLDAETLRAFIADKLSPIEMPKKIIIRTEPLPKTAVGKLSKKDLLVQEGIRK